MRLRKTLMKRKFPERKFPKRKFSAAKDDKTTPPRSVLQTLDAIDKHVGETLMHERESQNVKPDIVAAYLGVSVADIMAFEAGAAPIPLWHFHLMADILGLSMDEIFYDLLYERFNEDYLNAAADANFMRNYLMLERDAKNDLQDKMRDLTQDWGGVL